MTGKVPVMRIQRTRVKTRFTKMKKVQIVVRRTNILNMLRSLSDSEKSLKLDPDYLCSEESDSDTSPQSDTSNASSPLSKEREGLLIELIEVIGEDKSKTGTKQ